MRQCQQQRQAEDAKAALVTHLSSAPKANPQAANIQKAEQEHSASTLRANRVFAGEIVGIQRREAGAPVNAFVTDRAPPADVDVKGRWLTILLGEGVTRRFATTDVGTQVNKTLLVVGEEEPGLALEMAADPASKEPLHYVHYLWRPHACVIGKLRFTVTDSAAWSGKIVLP